MVEGAGGTGGMLLADDMPSGFFTLQRREIFDARLIKDCDFDGGVWLLASPRRRHPLKRAIPPVPTVDDAPLESAPPSAASSIELTPPRRSISAATLASMARLCKALAACRFTGADPSSESMSRARSAPSVPAINFLLSVLFAASVHRHALAES